MKIRFLTLLSVLILLFGLTTSVSAQEYSFQLPREVVHVYLNADGTMALDYAFTFKNDPSAHVIDFVDVGLPNSNFDLNTITADVDGAPINVTTSDYQGSGSGVAAVLGNKFIRETGTVNVRVGRITQMFFPDSENDQYASAEFAPTYFGSQYVHGATDLTVIFHLPPGVKPEEPKYHLAQGGWPGKAEPVTGLDENGRITYTWQSPDANGSTQYTFGASFPETYLPKGTVVRLSALELMLGAIGALIGLLANIFPFCCFAGFFFGIPIWGVISERKRKLQYIKPTISTLKPETH